MVYCVGLTGNIASGKTTVTELFGQLGVTVYNADAIARYLTAKNQPAYQQIVSHFGPEILLANGDIDRRGLREKIFNHAPDRTWLEDLLHPLIRLELIEHIKHCKTPYCLIEIPLLTNKTLYPYLNRILLISASEPVQIARVIQRDHCTKTQAKAILSAQPDISLRLKLADDVLLNDSGLDELKLAVERLHHDYLDASQHL